MNRTVMWPVRNDMARDECRKCLRCLELDAYGSMVSVLRAQGPFTGEKQRILQELAKVLHISNERHRAEVRRAVNDERLAMIAEQLSGPNTGTDWTIEGRRTIPLLPRLKARNAFTTLANSLSLATAAATERKPTVHEKVEEFKELETEPLKHVKLEEEAVVRAEVVSTENVVRDRKRPLHEITDSDRNLEAGSLRVNHAANEQNIIPEERKSSPLPTPPPNKVFVLSSNSLEAFNHGLADKNISHENNVNTSQHQSVKVVPLNIPCTESNLTVSSKIVASESCVSSYSPSQPSKPIATTVSMSMANGTKCKARITPTQNKVGPKAMPAVALGSGIGNNVQSEVQETRIPEITTPFPDAKITTLPQNSARTIKADGANSGSSCIKRVASIIHSNVKPATTTKTVVSTNTHRVMAVCPGTTVSSGPGPPFIKQTATTLTCKKLPSAMLNHQTTAKMGVTFNSNKTVNIAHHPNAKLTSKTNVIVIQKGHTKGVTLSHAGKEVLGKVIMGGKNLRVASQQNASSVNAVQQHNSLNNGDQAATALSPVKTTHAESVKTNMKDVLEKNKVLSQLIEESKTVIQNTSGGRFLRDEESSGLHPDKETSLRTDPTVMNSIADERQQRKRKDVCANVNSQRLNSIDPSSFMGTKEIFICPSQLTSTEDDNISNIEIEDSICGTEIDMFDATLGSADISFENFHYLMEDGESQRNPLLSVSRANDHSDS